MAEGDTHETCRLVGWLSPDKWAILKELPVALFGSRSSKHVGKLSSF